MRILNVKTHFITIGCVGLKTVARFLRATNPLLFVKKTNKVSTENKDK